MPDNPSYNAPSGGVLASLTLQVLAGNQGQQSLFMNLDDSFPENPGTDLQIFDGTGITTISVPVEQLGDGYHGEGVACVPLDCTVQECPAPTGTPTATMAGTPSPTPTPGHVPSQNATMSLDMVVTGNSYDDATNTMSVGQIDNCLTSPSGDNARHNHPAHLIIQNVEDLVGWQARLNYVGDQMRPSTFNPIPFTDSTTGQGVGFVNLPIDSATSVHRDVVVASDIPRAAAGPQSAMVGAVYSGAQSFAISPDTPAKSVPDDTSYTAPDGGVLASLTLEVLPGSLGRASLFMNLDDGSPETPGTDLQIFTGDGLAPVTHSIPVDKLGDGYHGEGRECTPLDCTAQECPASFPTPTEPPPTPTPFPTHTPTPSGPVTPMPEPRGTFEPQLSATYSDTAPGSNPDIASTLGLGLGPNGVYEAGQGDDTGDYNFAGIVNFLPSAPVDADIPDGALVGSKVSTQTLALLNNACTGRVDRRDQFMEGTTDINNVVHMQPFGEGNELGPMAGDNPPYDGRQQVKPPPAVTQYPAFLNAIFDPDWVDYGPDRIPGNADDNNGPQPPLRPRFRAVATTWLSFASLWLIEQQVVFEPGTDLPQLPAFDPATGYPSVSVFQTSSVAGSATPPIAGAITDTCSPYKEDNISYGVTRDNPDTPADESGAPLRTLPSQTGAQVTSVFYSFSQRDADRDGYENTMDPCPFHADWVWNPRDPSREGDTDVFVGAPAPDGIPNSCDPDPAAPGTNKPTDNDFDLISNSGDNCPLHRNTDQADGDRNADGEVVGDGIGDVCDTPGTDPGVDSGGQPIPGPRTVSGNGPLVPDGAQLICIRTVTINVGGPGEAGISDCMQTLPSGPPPSPTPTRTPAPPQTPTPTSTATAEAPTPTPEPLQKPIISLDMVPAGNTYDETTNTMSLGTIDNCLTTASPGNNAQHTHQVHLVIQDVEDLIGWQARLNYRGDQMRPSTFNSIPFTDNTTGQGVGFVNLPIDQAAGIHRDVVVAADIPPAAPEPQYALIGAVYNGAQGFAVSPDTPTKPVADDSSYSAPSGGVLASLTLQVMAGNDGQESLFMNLDDGTPNDIGTDLQIFDGDGLITLEIPSDRLGDGYHGEGAACVPLDCVNFECPGQVGEATAPAPTPTPQPTRTPTPWPTPTPAQGACMLDDNDFDNDGAPNGRDGDDDNDGIRDGRDRDDDNDGIRDRRDDDDDNDGIPDRRDRDDGRLYCRASL